MAQFAYVDTAYQINNYIGNQNYYSVKFSDDKYVLVCYGATTTLVIDLIAVNSVGDTLWTTSFNIDSVTQDYFIYHAAIDSNRNILIAGAAYIDSTQMENAMLLKCDSSGNPQWVKTYPSNLPPNSYGGLFGFVPIITMDDHYLLVCQIGIDTNNADFLIIKMDTSGNEISRWQYGTPHYQLPWAGIQTSDSGFLFAGYTSKDDSILHLYGYYSIYAVKTDKDGNMLWAMSYPQGYNSFGTLDGDAEARGAIEDNDGYILCGHKPNIDNAVQYNHGNGPLAWDKCWVGKVNKSDGSLIWEKYYGPDSLLYYANFFDIKRAPDSNFILVSKYDWNNSYANSAGFYKIGRNGDSLWSVQFNYHDSLNPGVILYSVNTISTEGYLGAGYLYPNNIANSQFAWVVTIDSNGCATYNCKVGTGIEKIESDKAGLLIYPNPTNGNSIIDYTFNERSQYNRLEISNLLGEVIATYSLKELTGEVQFNKPQLAAGIYLCALKQDGKLLVVTKFVKE